VGRGKETPTQEAGLGGKGKCAAAIQNRGHILLSLKAEVNGQGKRRGEYVRPIGRTKPPRVEKKKKKEKEKSTSPPRPPHTICVPD